MKKGIAITLGVVIVGAAGWMGATWYTGKRIEERSQDYLARANESLARLTPFGGLKLEQRQYERGVFSTQARYALSFEKSPNSPKELPSGTIEFVSTIEHGPFPKGALAHGVFAPKLAFAHTELARTSNVEPVFKLTRDVTPIVSDDIVSYNGDIASVARIAAFDITENGTNVKFSGMRIDGTFDRSATAVKAHAVVDSLSADKQGSDAFKMNLSTLTIDADNRAGKFGFSIGDSAVKIKHMAIIDARKNVNLLLDDFGYSVSTDEGDKMMGAQGAYELGKLTVNGTELGGGRIAVKMANLDGLALQEGLKAYEKLIGQIVAEKNPDDLKDELLPVFLSSGKKILAGKPTLAIEPISWKTGKGESTLNFSVGFTLPEGEIDDLKPEEILVKAIERMDGKLVVSKPMLQDMMTQYVIKNEGATPEAAAKEAEDQVRSLAGMAEMFNAGKNEGDNIVGTFSYANGKGNLNGTEIPAEELFAGLLASARADEEEDLDDAADAAEAAADAAAQAAAADVAGMMTEFDLDDIVAMLEDLEYEVIEQRDGEDGPVLVLDPEPYGASELRIDFLCTDGNTGCYDMVFVATYGSKTPLSLKSVNDWNQEYRWSRVYLDDKRQAVLEMDMNAEGGIGRENVKILTNTFMSIAEDFAEFYENKGKW